MQKTAVYIGKNLPNLRFGMTGDLLEFGIHRSLKKAYFFGIHGGGSVWLSTKEVYLGPPMSINN